MFNDCYAGDPGCNNAPCEGSRECNADNCQMFHTHGDNLEKYDAVCCGSDGEYVTSRHVTRHASRHSLSQDLFL